MNDFVMPLLLQLDVSSLTMSLVNIASPHGEETALADSIEAALRPLAHLEVSRVGDTVMASTHDGHDSRVALVGRLGTAPSTEEPLARVEMGKLYGPGAADAKGALAMLLKAAAVTGCARDVTFVFGSVDDAPPADVVLLAGPTGSTVAGASDHPLAQALVALTDVPSVAAPALAFGPGDASADFVPTAELSQCEFVLRQWLTT